MADWAPDIILNDSDAAALIRAQFPALASATCERIGLGWDNTVFLVGQKWIFRFPRRAVALPGIQREMEVLPVLAPLLPLRIPHPVFFGSPTETFPHPFFGFEGVQGREAPEWRLSNDERARLAPAVAGFLRVLHGPVPVEACGASLQFDPLGRSDMRRRVEKALPQLDVLRASGLWSDVAPFRRILVEAEQLPRETLSCVIHGDLHFRHLMLDEKRTLSGVIDWGDLQRNEPCVDLQLYWSFFDAEGRKRFLDGYGPVRDTQLMKARVMAVFLAASLAVYGAEEKMDAVRDEGVRALELCLIE